LARKVLKIYDEEFIYSKIYVQVGDEMSNVLAFISVKGGVGKTTVALETASSLANKFGKKVLLVDANFSAPNVGLYLDLNKNDVTLHDALFGVGLHNAIYEAHGFDVVCSSLHYGPDVDMFKLKNLLSKFKNRYDYIILDSSPHYSEMIPVVAAADKIFVVTSPDHVTIATSLKAALLAKKNQTPIEGIIVNKIRDEKHEEDLKSIESTMELPVLARIRDDKLVVRAVFHRTPVSLYDDKSHVSREIHRFASALVGEPEREGTGFFKRIFSGEHFSKEKVNREFMRQKFYVSRL
jgi:pilus assembly protein CpaE